MSKFPLALAALALLVAGILAFGPPWNGAAPAGEDLAVERLARRVEQLAQRLDRETADRQALEEILAGLTADLTQSFTQRLERDRESAGLSNESNPSRASRGEASVARSGPQSAGFDRQALLEAGFSRRDVEAYNETLDDLEMQQLALRDQAVREGWLQTPRFLQEVHALTDELEASRESFGEEFADWALFASGVPNRVRISSVISGSPAAEAGIEAGDIVHRYAGSSVRAMDGLRNLTTAGAAGASTSIDILRDGQIRRMYLPRGPLGVRIEPVLQEPLPLR